MDFLYKEDHQQKIHIVTRTNSKEIMSLALFENIFTACLLRYFFVDFPPLFHRPWQIEQLQLGKNHNGMVF